MADDGALSVGEYVRFLFGGKESDDCPSWPPDAFAVAAALLQRSGAYRWVVTKWPPAGPKWNEDILVTGAEWRDAAGYDGPPPAEVCNWWSEIRNHDALSIDELREKPDLAHLLLQICAAADEASADAGIYIGPNDEFSRIANECLGVSGGRTLCRQIHPSRMIVLPKLHTPQSGLTMRSISHHLALYMGGQTRPVWRIAPVETALQNVLILPWPREIDPKHFTASKGDPANMPDCYRYFSYDLSLESRGFELEEAVQAVKRAEEQVGRVDAVVLPELALRGDDYFELSKATGKMVIAGVGTPASKAKLATNSAAAAVPIGGMPAIWKQSKHHRWRLDDEQIAQYGLADRFDGVGHLWWEHIALGERELHFFALNNYVTMAVLICEDLARLDPVNELVATVGPTLVVALLMDGPQLPSRWPGRYATVLTDDPGSSVLSVTSLGMLRRYKHPTYGTSPVFALWKDAKSTRGAVPISMKHDDSLGVVLKLTLERFPEWTADGRSDFDDTFYLMLDGDPEEIRS